MKPRKVGSVFRASYKDKRTGALKHSSRWSIRYYVNGQMRQEQTGTIKKAEAEKILQARLAAIAQGRPVGPDVDRTTFEDLGEMIRNDYKVNERDSIDRLERSLAHLKEIFGGARAAEMTEDRIAVYVTKRKEQDCAENATVNRELAALKRAFRLAERAGRVARRPYIAMLKENNARKGFLDPEQFEAVLRHLPEDSSPWSRLPTSRAGASRPRSSRATGSTWTSMTAGCAWNRARPRTTRGACSP